MKKILIFTVIAALLQLSCNDDKGSTLTVSTNELELDAAGNGEPIVVKTNETLWSVANETSWINIEREGKGNVIVRAVSNTRKETRSAKIIICAGDRYERINITQGPSLRTVGEAYPDASDPAGILYKMSDGGLHGTIVSLDQIQCPWGPTGTSHPGVLNNFRDGRAATRTMIETYRNDPDFAENYPAFHWVYEKNGHNLDGEWYIPAYFQLLEMHYLTTGNTYSIPETGNPPSQRPVVNHDIEAREYFNEQMVAAGGTPITFMGVCYWASSETSVNNANTVLFNSGNAVVGIPTTSTNASKSTATFYVRAIREF